MDAVYKETGCNRFIIYMIFSNQSCLKLLEIDEENFEWGNESFDISIVVTSGPNFLSWELIFFVAISHYRSIINMISIKWNNYE